MSRNYELTLMVDSQQSEDGIEKTVQKYTGLISEQGGAVHKTDSWGVRKLAFEIRKHQQASYTFVQFQGEPVVLEELERSCKLDEAVLRHMVVTIDELDALPEPVETEEAGESEAEEAEESEAEEVEAEESEADESNDEEEASEPDDAEGSEI